MSAASHLRWSPAEVSRLVDMRKAGYSPNDIGLMMGRSRGAVLGKLDRLGLTKASGDTMRTVQLITALAQTGATRSDIARRMLMPLRTVQHLVRRFDIGVRDARRRESRGGRVMPPSSQDLPGATTAPGFLGACPPHGPGDPM